MGFMGKFTTNVVHYLSVVHHVLKLNATTCGINSGVMKLVLVSHFSKRVNFMVMNLEMFDFAKLRAALKRYLFWSV